MKIGAQNVIVSDSDQSEDKEETNNMIENLTQTLYSSRTNVSVFTLGKINKILKEYRDPDYQLTDFDKRLLLSFYNTGKQV